MSLVYIIDGYNVIHHPRFITNIRKKTEDSRTALLEFIRINKPCGSPRNKIILIFDGHPDLKIKGIEGMDNPNIIFSRKETADERIRKTVELSGSRKNIVVVSDDKEIKLFVRALGARTIAAEEFLNPKEKLQGKKILLTPELTYSQMQEINQELRKIWLE